MKNASKYAPGFFPPEKPSADWARRSLIERAPRWCAIDLRDGNQALPTPMGVEQKLEYFGLLVALGYKEIEVGFPAASDTEFGFVRRLIDENLIPDDVTIQVITQAREHIVQRTFAAIKGAKRAIVHLYTSVSKAWREQVFGMSRDEVAELAVYGAKLCRTCAKLVDGCEITLEYSPESFTGAEPDYSMEVIDRVLDAWQPEEGREAIVNLPSTVSLASPNIFANLVEYVLKNLNGREFVTLSVHPHNDRGTAVAEAELALLAGAQRVEGCLFGLGERAGGADLVTLALNMYSQGVDPCVDLGDLPDVRRRFERLTGMAVGARQPYAGELAFTAFSGSHQDAIAKGLKWRAEHPNIKWSVPYLTLDPSDIGERAGADVIRINSQSGGGGAAFKLEHAYGFRLPKGMKRDFGAEVGSRSDRLERELTAEDLRRIFMAKYSPKPYPLRLIDCHFERGGGERIYTLLDCEYKGEALRLRGGGNGRLDAVAAALRSGVDLDFKIDDYEEHALSSGSTASAAAYVGVDVGGRIWWGVGVESDIIFASINALFAALNSYIADGGSTEDRQ